jgi:outer membrane receptor protein involved in Fe transport
VHRSSSRSTARRARQSSRTRSWLRTSAASLTPTSPDSLSHITGITIQRTRGGEGQYVNVRGLGPEFSIVTLNGRILATDGDGREFAFDVLPSEVISGADVLKSAEAPNLEGSIGGSINLRSARPLEGFGERLSSAPRATITTSLRTVATR